MDIQAILAASDSSEDDDDDLPVDSRGGIHLDSNGMNLQYRFSDTSSNVELEQILREDEDGDDEIDDPILNEKFSYNHGEAEEGQGINGSSYGLARTVDAAFRERARTDLPDHSHYPYTIDRSFSDEYENTYPTESFTTSQSHNAEDWAVLQAILQEDDENDGVEGWLETTADSSAAVLPSLSSPLIDREDRSRDHGRLVDDLLDNGESESPKTPSFAQVEGRSEGKISSHKNLDESFTHSGTIAKHPAHNGSVSGLGTVAKGNKNAKYSTKSSSGKDDWLDEETSSRSLTFAMNYERKLLKSGHREIVSPLMVKRRLKPKIDLASRADNKVQRKRQTVAERVVACGIPRFGFSGVVENTTMNDISKSMGSHARVGGAKVHCGLPTCLSFNSKFIAVGTQLGYILVYDLFEVLRQRLSTKALDDHVVGGKKPGSITSVDLSYDGEVVVAGYASGLLLLWDTIKGIVVRSVVDTHPSPIASVRFLSDLKMVTVDAGGLVNKLTFSKNILWSNYSMDTDCLLDGTAGQILAMNVLPPFSTVNPLVRPEEFEPILKSLTLIALSSERSSFVVAVDPKVNVLHRWARPPPERTEAIDTATDLPTSQTYLPCLAWGWALVSGGQNVVMPILARAWGCCLQLLCSSFPTVDDDGVVSGAGEQQLHWPAFGLHQEIDTIAPVVALEWLSDRSLVYLTVTNEFTLVDTVMMTLLERLDFSGLELVYAEFSLSRSTERVEDSGGACTTTFQNSIRSSDDRLLVLCREEVRRVSIVSARRRISSLEEDGEWLEALALALDHYESTVTSQEDRRRDQTGLKDLSRHPEFSAAKSEDEEWIAKLLMRYINLAVDNAPDSSGGQKVDYLSTGGLPTALDLAQSHFQMLAGVCVEFCVVTKRLDLLFGPIFRRFQSAGYTSVFLDVLEPYVLSDKLAYVAPEVMSFFVEHCKATNGIATVERCLLHMDCTIMDFDTILSLLRANEMYSALFYVFNQGLDDYVSPLEIIMERLFDEADAGSGTKSRRKDGVLETMFERLGYKSILYLRTCFEGNTFPKETEIMPNERRQAVRRELMNFLTRDGYVPSSQFRKGASVVGQRALIFPYMRLLLLVDPKAMLDTVALALDATESSSSRASWGEQNTGTTRMPDRQEILTVLVSIVLPTHGGLESLAIEAPGLANAFLDFTAKYVISSAVQVDKEIIFMIARRMADQFAQAQDAESQKKAQRQIMELLSALPRDSYDPDNVLELITAAGIHRAALLLHQQVASSWHEDGTRDIELRSSHFKSAIDCYLGDQDESFRREVFDYVKKECSGVANSLAEEEGERPTSLRDALLGKLPALVNLDAIMTARLVAELFVDDLDRVVTTLEADPDEGRSLFRFFQAIVSGELVQLDPVAGSVLNLTMEHHHKYLAIMARLHPEQVYDYLSTHDNYRTEECLKLCQEYDIADASAYLLERLGNVSSALQLILQTLESRMMNLKRSIRGMGVDVFRKQPNRNPLQNRKTFSSGLPAPLSSSQTKDIESVKRILVVALDLCQRNSGTLSSRSEHGSQLWFNVLDRLINAKGFLRLSKEQPEHAKAMAGVLSELLQLTMQRMVSSVPLPDLVRKLTSDKGSRLGELREMVESLLGTYGFELRVFEGAITVFHQDVFTMQNAYRNLQVEAVPVRSVMSVSLEEADDKKRDDKTENELRVFLRRSSFYDMALCVGGGRGAAGTAATIDSDGLPFSSRSGTGFGSALSKLRSKRRQGLGGGASTRIRGKGTNHFLNNHARRSALNMMTVDEQLYQGGQFDSRGFDRRPVGALGEAEHRGRLMTFH